MAIYIQVPSYEKKPLLCGFLGNAYREYFFAPALGLLYEKGNIYPLSTCETREQFFNNVDYFQYLIVVAPSEIPSQTSLWDFEQFLPLLCSEPDEDPTFVEGERRMRGLYDRFSYVRSFRSGELTYHLFRRK